MKISELFDYSPLLEGGNVFSGKTASINLENIKPTLNAYFNELKSIFPKKASIFNLEHFTPLGSVGKKAISGDIDLGVDVKNLLDQTMSDKSITLWNINPEDVNTEFEKLKARAKTSTPEQLRMKAFLKLLTLYINAHAKNLYCDEKKVTSGNIFGLYPQIDVNGKNLGIGCQIDWMVGDLDWLSFSYYSAAYPPESNIKGLHRSQLLLSAFQGVNLSFNHVNGVKDKETGKVVASNPTDALKILSSKLGVTISREDAEDYYKLHAILKTLPKELYNRIIDTYLKILDSTRCDIPDDLQKYWITNKKRLGLTGKFLPDTSKLTSYLGESGVAGGDRIKSREDFIQFLKSYKTVISKFPGFVSLKPSGSYNSNLSKTDFGDIDLVVTIKSDKDKPTVKKELVSFFNKFPDTVIVPFSSPKYIGRKSYNSGEIVTVRYHDAKLGYSAQIDNILALSPEEATFKGSFLDMPAEVQGLVLGLIKVATLETPEEELFKRLGINAETKLPENEEYEFNLSSVGLQLRRVTYEPNSYKQLKREVVWESKNANDVKKLLLGYDISKGFDLLLDQIKNKIKNPRSGKRISGVFQSMITTKSGEQGTPKGDEKERGRLKVQQVLG